VSATPPNAISPPGSLAGYSFKAYLVRNASGIKILVAAIFGYGSSLLGLVHDPALNTLVAIGLGTLSKFALDAVDFWLSAVPVTAPVPLAAPLSPSSVADAVKRAGNG
jgi:hypothetical protein